MARILVVEDDDQTARAIGAELERHGHTVDYVTDGASSLEHVATRSYDAMTLDRLLPAMDGLSVVAAMRTRGLAVPVLMISALSDVDERIAGLRAGGDDYLVKPFAPEEMAMRVEALLRRGSMPETLRRLGCLEIDVLKREVRVDGLPVRLLNTEFRLLEFLALNVKQVVSRKLIFERVWGYHFDPGANLINVHIARLRGKLDRPGRPSLIATVKGEGYRLDVDG
jgi:two-component system OmpR family response regulator